MITDEIIKDLFEMQDRKYRDFQCKLIPTADKETFIGIRTPALRDYAKKVLKREDADAFLSDLPHRYFDENQLHAFVLSGMKDYERCVDKVNRFLPYVDNWATCDQMSPKVFKKHKDELLEHIRKWIVSDRTYTVRFGIGMLMEHFLDDGFDVSYPQLVADISSEEYYVNMMRAWYFATALAKHYDEVIPFVQDKRLDIWTHNKTIQKCVESNRISDDQKKYLKSLKIK